MTKYGVISLLSFPIIVILLFTVRLEADPYLIVFVSIIIAIIGIILAFKENKKVTIISLMILHSMTLTYLFFLFVTVLFLDARVQNG
ncbi:hypothetical protein J14TS2_49710 [Bacillus sp. J14TS2]|nr:hypothetical protein J14TS2_49710 [Bacillus sp. J14TS2]